MTGLADEVLADPVGLIVRLVGNVEKHLPAEYIRDIVLTVVRARAGRRSLAQALHNDPSLLRTGQPPAPYCVGCRRHADYLKSQPAAKVRHHHVVAFDKRYTFKRVCQISLIDWRYGFKRRYYYFLRRDCLYLLDNHGVAYRNAGVVPHKTVYADYSLAFV